MTAESVWQEAMEKQFLREMADGTLRPERFRSLFGKQDLRPAGQDPDVVFFNAGRGRQGLPGTAGQDAQEKCECDKGSFHSLIIMPKPGRNGSASTFSQAGAGTERGAAFGAAW